ncbi:MAG: type II secretion system minor pseudopilin GspI [Gammaproteobacteria bacterium]|nr:type II secretion system minor pseudopilin GspI [Gammaproteobacteria bacterium]
MKMNFHNQRGFTLVEVLIALLIVSIAFSAILFSVNQNVRTQIRLEEKIAAMWVTEDVISRAQLGLLKANNGVQASLNKEWGWQLRTKATQNAYVQEIEVTILDPQKNTISVSTGYIGTSHAQ